MERHKKRLLVGFCRRPGFMPVTYQPIAWVRTDLGTTGFKAVYWSERRTLQQQSVVGLSGIEPLIPEMVPGVLPLAPQIHMIGTVVRRSQW